MHRIFIAPTAIQHDRITLTDPDELHHVLNVMRVNVGTQVECLDGTGGRYRGTVTQCARQSVVIHIDERQHQQASEVGIMLAPALIKPERFEWVIQKATELGVTHIAPLITTRTISRPPRERAEHKLTRWQRIVKEAAKQCGRPTIPALETPQPFSRFVQKLPRTDLVLIPTLAVAGVSLHEILGAHRIVQRATMLIGPEGDFTSEEVREAQTHGAHAVSLGAVTLRAETAALAVLTILQYVSGQFAHQARSTPPIMSARGG